MVDSNSDYMQGLDGTHRHNSEPTPSKREFTDTYIEEMAKLHIQRQEKRAHYARLESLDREATRYGYADAIAEEASTRQEFFESMNERLLPIGREDIITGYKRQCKEWAAAKEAEAQAQKAQAEAEAEAKAKAEAEANALRSARSNRMLPRVLSFRRGRFNAGGKKSKKQKNTRKHKIRKSKKIRKSRNGRFPHKRRRKSIKRR